jgi:hypothetical protein
MIDPSQGETRIRLESKDPSLKDDTKGHCYQYKAIKPRPMMSGSRFFVLSKAYGRFVSLHILSMYRDVIAPEAASKSTEKSSAAAISRSLNSCCSHTKGEYVDAFHQDKLYPSTVPVPGFRQKPEL